MRHGSIFDDDDDIPEGYDIAQICLFGHMVNNSAHDFPEHNKDFCTICGKKTIAQCPTCGMEIRGNLRNSGILMGEIYVPDFCHGCGRPYPWTQARLEAARELAIELDTISDEEKTILAGSIEDLVREGPKTTLAATRFKKIVTKAGSVAAESFKEILINVVSETAKKIIYPNS